MRKLSIAAVILMLTGAMAYAAPLSWDFNDGLQGWSPGTIGAGTATWVDPAVDPNGPELPDGEVSGGGAGNIYAPDGSYVSLDISSQLVGGMTDSWKFSCDAYVPNLRPLSGFTWGYPGNWIDFAGLWGKGDSWAIGIQGDIDRGSAEYVNYPADDWDGQCVGSSEWLNEDTATPDSEWWDDTVTLELDYQFTTTGVTVAKMTIPWDSVMGPAGTYTLYDGPIDATPGNGFWADDTIDTLILGSNPHYSSWTQAQFDNVTFDSPDLIPEPATLGLLSLGSLVLLRRRRNA